MAGLDDLDEDLDEDEYTDATHRMIALGYAITALFGAVVGALLASMYWLVAR